MNEHGGLVKLSQHTTKTKKQPDSNRYLAWCPCGWMSKHQDTEEEANDQAADHIVAIARSGG